MKYRYMRRISFESLWAISRLNQTNDGHPFRGENMLADGAAFNQPEKRADGRLSISADLPAVARQCFSIAETAKMLNVSVGTVRGCISVGSLPVMRIGRRVVVTRATLENLLGGPIA